MDGNRRPVDRAGGATAPRYPVGLIVAAYRREHYPGGRSKLNDVDPQTDFLIRPIDV
ncbi:MAG: hypothetical protein ABF459_17100 [Gluconobacter cerinus]|uniref:hypothetical protein n=1 Tax=Gluconobacter cerinus TaxID=38307 RepID=UPI0039EB88F6